MKLKKSHKLVTSVMISQYDDRSITDKLMSLLPPSTVRVMSPFQNKPGPKPRESSAKVSASASKIGTPPWITSSSRAISLSEELVMFSNYVSLHDVEAECREAVLEDIREGTYMYTTSYKIW